MITTEPNVDSKMKLVLADGVSECLGRDLGSDILDTHESF